MTQNSKYSDEERVLLVAQIKKLKQAISVRDDHITALRQTILGGGAYLGELLWLSSFHLAYKARNLGKNLKISTRDKQFEAGDLALTSENHQTNTDDENYKQGIVNRRITGLIKKSGLFSIDYYLKNNRDVARSGLDPLQHFLIYGGFEGRNPSDDFNSKYYLTQNPDVREARINPLVHYLTIGKLENRRPKPTPEYLGKKNRKTNGGIKKRKNIAIINVNFYDWQGEVLYKGGAERYVYDLACIIKSLGHNPTIYQNANKPFEKTYRDIRVVGVCTESTSIRGMSRAFRAVCADADLVVASPLDLACELSGLPVIGISHGIHWDHIGRELFSHRTDDYKDIFDALSSIKAAVCVDTNFINWTRTYDYQLGSKLRYIPNYFDSHEFHPVEKRFDGKLTVMYPRRLYQARGIYITLEAFDYLLNKYNQIELLLVGQTTDKDVIEAVSAKMEKYKGRITLEEYDMEDMHKAYSQSHIVLIPTLFSEGTSLSCLEGMATNNAVIATNVGGLPNLVIDGYNGCLIEPTADDLIRAVEELEGNRDRLHSLAKKAQEVTAVFEKQNWNAKWEKLLKEEL